MGDKFTNELAMAAMDDLREYRQGKQSIDEKATLNQEWWRLRHWDVIHSENNEGTKASKSVGSAWAVNSLLNKHADIMDSFPKPNILPREAVFEEEARMLSQIIPSILEQNDYEKVYRTVGWDFCIDGAAITGVFWDSSKNDGMGDIAISNVDVHNVFWQPGIEDIQDSEKVFHVVLQDVDKVKMAYPQIADKIGPMDSGLVAKYLHDDNIDTSNCVEVVNMYYKLTTMQPVYMDGLDADGNPTKVAVHQIPKTVVHFAIIVDGKVAFASENDPTYANGFYEHGRYPFVIRKLFPIKDSLWGFGYLDIMKNPQKDIDRLDQAIIKNAELKTRPRFWVKHSGNINVDDFADWNREIVEVASGDLNESVKQIEIDTVPTAALQHYASKIDELKETSGNRDFSQGSTASGVTAASAIAALQEAGSKLSRDINKELYRGSREEYYLVIELIRQFYTEPRPFRVDDNMGGYRFENYSNENLQPQQIRMSNGTVQQKEAVFDIKVTAEKSSPFSRAAQNETAKELYQLGLFAPENSIPALVCIDMMDFEGKDKVKQQIEQNSIMLNQFNSAMNLISQLSVMNPQIAQMSMQMGLVAPEQLAALETQQMSSMTQAMDNTKGTPEERAAKTKGEHALVTKARERAAKSSIPQ